MTKIAEKHLATGWRLVRAGAGIAAIGLGLAACTTPYAARDKTYLPASTPRISAPKERARQLSTGTYKDDIPEFTTGPGIDSRWPYHTPRIVEPAPVPRLGKLAYLDDSVSTRPDTAN